MLKFFFNGSPNPNKVALFLEESGLPYEPVPIDIVKGEQFAPEYLAINPNGKLPAIVDDETAVFDSNAILLYLAEKTGLFLPADRYRADLLSWLMFVASGLGPYSGQAVHFNNFAPDTPYAKARYNFEAKRHLAVLDTHLSGRSFMVGDAYSIVDMAVWGWASLADFVTGESVLATLPNLSRLVEAINARPAASRARAIKERFTFSSVGSEEARRMLFRHVQREA